MKKRKAIFAAAGILALAIIGGIVIGGVARNVTGKPYTFKNEEYAVKGIYTGEWKNYKPNGQGKFAVLFDSGISGGLESSCELWEGEWKDGDLNGHVKITSTSGFVFEGVYKDGLPAQGKITWPGGNVFEGGYNDDGTMYNGFCKRTFANGDVSEGEYSGGAGQGKMTYANGDVYEGELRNGRPDGHGKITYANGDVKEGEWKNGEFEE